MSDKHINDGGPAFPGRWYDFQPITGEQVVCEQWGGMTLRDYFAAKAMQGHFASSVATHGVDVNVVAKHSYAMTDIIESQMS